jgi:hypothetical protein
MTAPLTPDDLPYPILHPLLFRVVDYAGLFPPASLTLPETVKNYAAYLQSPDSWMLGRLIIPISKLEEFELALHALPPPETRRMWLISALVGNDWAADTEKIITFNKQFSQAERILTIDTVEFKAANPSDIEQATKMLPPAMLYVEISLDDSLETMIEALSRHHLRAKVRTGGITQDSFPTAKALARFISLCAKYHVPFKATAGLHHPIRANYRLTYDPHPPEGIMFGFLNVFLAGCYAETEMSETDLTMLLEETDPKAFLITPDEITWQSQLLTHTQIELARNRFAMSFGSCSFDEPVADLKSLQLL